MVDLEEIKKAVLGGEQLESVLQKFGWKEFEWIIAQIFQNNGFYVKQNFRFKTKNRYEIDLLAVSSRFSICVDCKYWSQGRNKKSGLKSAAKKQEERVKELQKFLKKNLIAKEMLKINRKAKFHPMIVTLFEEDLVKENDTIVLPAWKLNSFLIEFENYLG